MSGSYADTLLMSLVIDQIGQRSGDVIAHESVS